MNELRYKHSFKLEAVTPVSVGSGNTISPYADFFLRRDKAYYVNQQRVERKLEKEPHLIDKYVTEIRRGMNNNLSDFDLYDFLEEELNIDTSDFTNVKVFGYSFDDEEANKKHEVNQLIREAGKPYIPGSTLKGAIRTAMLYDWLVNTQAGQEEMKKLCNGVLKFIIQPKYKRWAELKTIEKRSDFEKRELRNLTKELEEPLKELKSKVFNETRLFGTVQKNENLFSRDFIVRDTLPFSKDDFGIYAAARIRRFDLKDNANDGEIPLACEAILPEKSTTFELLISKKQTFANSHLSYLAQYDSKILLQQLSHFTKACIDFEIESYQTAKTVGFEAEIKTLLDFYTKLRERSNNNEYFLRIGASKIFLDNVLVLALLNYKTNEFDIKDIYQHYGVIFDVQSRYPVTRTVTKIGSLPFGWVKIEQL